MLLGKGLEGYGPTTENLIHMTEVKTNSHKLFGKFSSDIRTCLIPPAINTCLCILNMTSPPSAARRM